MEIGQSGHLNTYPYPSLCNIDHSIEDPRLIEEGKNVFEHIFKVTHLYTLTAYIRHVPEVVLVLAQ